MGIFSLGVLSYQIVIAAVIIFAASKGKKFLALAVGLAVLWTLSHVFYPPLMLLQFCTIIGSGGYGYRRACRAGFPADRVIVLPR